jgi:hypothetical protein
MLAAVSMAMVCGSSVSSAAVRIPRAHFPRRSISAIMDAPESDEEHAVSMLMAGPAAHTSFIR